MFFEKQVFLNNVIGLIWKELILFSPLEVTGLASSSTYDVLVSFKASVSYDTLRHSYYSHLWDFFVIYVVKFLFIFNFFVARCFLSQFLFRRNGFECLRYDRCLFLASYQVGEYGNLKVEYFIRIATSVLASLRIPDCYSD